MDFDLFLKALLNIVQVVSIYIILSSLLGKSKYSQFKTISCYVLFYILVTYSYLGIGYPLVVLASNIIGIFGVSFLHKGSLVKKVFVTLFIISLFATIETLVVFLLSGIDFGFLKKISEDTISIIIIVKLFLFLFSLAIFIFSKKDLRAIVPKRYFRYLIFSSIINAVIITLLLLMGSGGRNIYLSFISFLLLIMNIIFFFIYNDMVDLFEKEHNNAQIKNQYELIKMQSDNINESIMELRKLEHDLKNKLTPIAYLVKEEKLDELHEHFDSIFQDFSKVSIFKESGILELDGILNSKYNKGKNLGIEFDSYISISDKINVNGMDLAVIMGNLLDNAIEGASKVSDKWIKFSIKETHGVLFISVENSYDGVVNIKNNEFLTRKEDKKLHGMGLRNIRTIIEKYDGDLDIKYNYSTFKAIIVLYEIY